MRFRPAAGVFVRLALMFGLMLLSWGLDDWRSFFEHPARAGLMPVGLLSGVLALFTCSDAQALRKGNKPVGRWMLFGWILFVLFLVLWLPYGDRFGLLVFRRAFDSLRYLGLALVAAGTALRLGSLPSLGKQFSGYVTLQEDHQLIQAGIYSVIRHPMYLGIVLSFPGVALVFRSWLAVLVFLVSMVFVLVRMTQEEKLLSGRFGAQFDDYRRRTWRLLPYIY